MLRSSLGLLIPGTVIGTGCALLLWDRVSSALSEQEAAMLEIPMNTGSIAVIAAFQLLSALLLVLVIGVHMTKDKPLSKRK